MAKCVCEQVFLLTEVTLSMNHDQSIRQAGCCSDCNQHLGMCEKFKNQIQKKKMY